MELQKESQDIVYHSTREKDNHEKSRLQTKTNFKVKPKLYHEPQSKFDTSKHKPKPGLQESEKN